MAWALGIAALAVLAAAAALHFYWVLGGRRGWDAAIPSMDGKRLFNPSRAGTAAVAVGLLALTLPLLAKLEILSLPLSGWMITAACWAVGLIFAARAIGDFRYVGVFKRRRGSTFARLDDLLYSPLCLFLGVAFAVVGMPGP